MSDVASETGTRVSAVRSARSGRRGSVSGAGGSQYDGGRRGARGESAVDGRSRYASSTWGEGGGRSPGQKQARVPIGVQVTFHDLPLTCH